MRKIKCNKCQYKWKTRSQLQMVSCPNCGSKQRIIKHCVTIKDEVLNELYERAKYACEECDSINNLEVHHIIPKQQKGQDKIENLMLLCSKCHKSKGISNRVAKDRKKIQISVTFEDKEYDELIKRKKDQNWHDYILGLQKRKER